jgi:hypothetical protein
MVQAEYYTSQYIFPRDNTPKARLRGGVYITIYIIFPRDNTPKARFRSGAPGISRNIRYIPQGSPSKAILISPGIAKQNFRGNFFFKKISRKFSNLSKTQNSRPKIIIFRPEITKKGDFEVAFQGRKTASACARAACKVAASLKEALAKAGKTETEVK